MMFKDIFQSSTTGKGCDIFGWNHLSITFAMVKSENHSNIFYSSLEIVLLWNSFLGILHSFNWDTDTQEKHISNLRNLSHSSCILLYVYFGRKFSWFDWRHKANPKRGQLARRKMNFIEDEQKAVGRTWGRVGRRKIIKFWTRPKTIEQYGEIEFFCYKARLPHFQVMARPKNAGIFWVLTAPFCQGKIEWWLPGKDLWEL